MDEIIVYLDALLIENKGIHRKRSRTWNKEKLEGSSKVKGNMECWYCRKKGYLKKEFWSRKVDGKEVNKGNNHEANMEMQFYKIL